MRYEFFQWFLYSDINPEGQGLSWKKTPLLKTQKSVCLSSICKENTGKRSRCRKLFIVAFQVL